MRTFLWKRRAAMAMRYQSSAKKSNRKFEVVGARQLAVHLPLPLVELWEELQPQVEHLAGCGKSRKSCNEAVQNASNVHARNRSATVPRLQLHFSGAASA